MLTAKTSIWSLMMQHLYDLMADAELYGLEPIRACHSVWLQQLEQGRVIWADEEGKHRYR